MVWGKVLFCRIFCPFLAFSLFDTLRGSTTTISALGYGLVSAAGFTALQLFRVYTKRHKWDWGSSSLRSIFSRYQLPHWLYRTVSDPERVFWFLYVLVPGISICVLHAMGVRLHQGFIQPRAGLFDRAFQWFAGSFFLLILDVCASHIVCFEEWEYSDEEDYYPWECH